MHPHRFRRTIATDLLNRGMPIEQVKEFLGHEKLDTTMIYCTVTVSYTHLDSAEQPVGKVARQDPGQLFLSGAALSGGY